MLRLLKPRMRANVREKVDEEPENEARSFHTPTKSVKITLTHNDDPSTSRNNVTVVK